MAALEIRNRATTVARLAERARSTAKGRSTVTEQLDRTLVWNQRHLMIVLREYEDLYNRHRPHRTLNQAAPLRPLPDGVIDLDQFRVRRRDRTGGVIHEYRLVA
jgi:putative transposase